MWEGMRPLLIELNKSEKRGRKKCKFDSDGLCQSKQHLIAGGQYTSQLRPRFHLLLPFTAFCRGTLLREGGVPRGYGADFTVPMDGVLKPGDIFIVEFKIRPASLDPFSFYVDLFGVVQ